MSEIQSRDVIQRLPESVANCIAAGEVIQRPASVIKELVENAVDAGARIIKIFLKDAGKTLIQVIDDGCGMSPSDARLAFEKHATSKIRVAEDMFALHTMGFRGEALPSISSVSEVEMRTMMHNESVGTKVVLIPGELTVSEPCVCTPGTNIMVKRLFFNFVARRRFLSKDQTELTHIMHEFERLALVNPDIQLEISHNGTLLHRLSPAPLKQRIGALFGKSVEQNLIPITTTTNVVTISGFIGTPASARRRGALQYFFVNGRNMKHAYFHRAVLNSFKDLISADAKPNFFINFQIDPSRIDVNVHPQKHEIKFEDEQLVWQILTAAIREALGKSNLAPAIDFDATDVPDIPPCIPGAQAPDAPVENWFDPTYTPFKMTADTVPEDAPRLFNPSAVRRGGMTSVGSALNKNWDKLFDAFANSTPGTEGSQPKDNADDVLSDRTSAPSAVAPRRVFQVLDRYIIVDNPDGILLIDQHRAHVNVLYHSLVKRITDHTMGSQRLIFEEHVELSPSQSAVLDAMREHIMAMGFEVMKDADNPASWLITAIPACLTPSAASGSLCELLTAFAAEENNDNTSDMLTRRAALAMARAGAMRGTVAMSEAETERLVDDLLKLETPGYTPDGLPVMKLLTITDLAALVTTG